MPRIFFGNFDFEHELAGAQSLHGRPGLSQRRQSAGKGGHSDLAWVWTAVAEAEDVILAGRQIDSVVFAPLARLGLPSPRFCSLAEQSPKGPDWQLIPWGWTDSLLQIAKENGWMCVPPPADVVRRVNSREFRFGLERDWNIGLDGAALVRSPDELEYAIRKSGDNPRGWLLKANYGMSGREAIRGRGQSIQANARSWALKRLAGSGPIVFEPVVDRVAEAGIQIEIPHAGAPELMGVTPLLADGSGVYRGSRFGCPKEELACWQPAVEVGLRTAVELQRHGYFGPLGIDAMQYRDDVGQLRLRPLQDLNARYTMGRLALGLRRLLAPCRVHAGKMHRKGESIKSFTSPPLAPPFEGGEGASGGTGAELVSRPTDADWCGSWLHFNERQLTGRDLWDWLDALTSTLSNDVIAVPASPQSGGVSPHRSVLVLAPSISLRNTTEALILASLNVQNRIG